MYACFDEHSEVIKFDGRSEVKVLGSTLQEGDLVATLDLEGRRIYTEVLYAQVTDCTEKEFVQIAVDGASMTVTTDHIVMLDGMQFKYAQDVKVGDVLITTDGKKEIRSRSEPIPRQSRLVLATADATVLIDGILVPTSFDVEDFDELEQHFPEVVQMQYKIMAATAKGPQ